MALALDGHATHRTATSLTDVSTLTTTSANDIIVAFFVYNSAQQTGTTVSDTAGLTWHQRAVSVTTGAKAITVEEWYAVASAALTSDSITFTLPTTASNIRSFTFGVSGADTTSPFDSNSSIPATAKVTGTNPSATISTTNANDFIFAAYGSGAVTQTITAYPTGFTLIDSAPSSGPNGADEYEIFSTVQTSLAVGFTLSTSLACAVIVDAIVQASGGVSVTGAEAVAESGSAVVSEKPTGAEHVAESSSVVFSQAPKVTETVSESGKAVVSEKPAGSEAVGEASSVHVTEHPVGSEHIAEASSVKYSQAPIGAETISESGKAVVSEKPTGAETIAETEKLVVSEHPTGAEHVAEA